MALRSGFFNSVNHDRTYSAEDFSRFFDGVITEGVFSNFGDHFAGSATGQGMSVAIGTGRAWIDGTWAYNDSAEVITLDSSESVLNRIDIIALEVNRDISVRACRFVVIKGSPASSPVAPSLSDGQYALCKVTIDAGVTTIVQSKIDSTPVGSTTPFVTSILQQTSIASLYAAWGAEFSEWEAEQKEELTEWLDTIHGILSDDAAANLTVKYLEMQAELASRDLEISFTLSKSAWSGNSQTVTIDGLTADMKAVFSVAEGSSDAAFQAASEAVLAITSHALNTLTIKAFGIVPDTVDIPCTLLVSKYDAFTGQNFAGVCSTAAATAAKTVSVSGVTSLMRGMYVIVRFTNGNTAQNPTLNVSGTGAKVITDAENWAAGETVGFVYDGTVWESAGAASDLLYDVIDGGTF